MSHSSSSPYYEFKTTLCAFAQGHHRIRNPFVVATVDPALEAQLTTRLAAWASDRSEPPAVPDSVTVQPIWLDELLVETDVYKLLAELGEHAQILDGDGSPEPRVEETLQENLPAELVEAMIEHELTVDQMATQSHVVLLFHLSRLSPFTTAAELVDELDRRTLRSTVGITVPDVQTNQHSNRTAGTPQRSYPAHQIETTIQKVDLQ